MTASIRHAKLAQPLIAEAIATQHLLQLDYAGSTRIVEPHIYGLDAQGREVLSAYQVTGGSISGETTGWKTFEIAKVTDVEVLAAHFSRPRREYNPADAMFQIVYSRL